MNIPVENLVIDGERKTWMEACDENEKDDFCPPFALFSPDLQVNVGGPYAKWEHARDALDTIKSEEMIPYTYAGDVTWTVNGQPSKWYDKQR